jgi:hypothetical protein
MSEAGEAGEGQAVERRGRKPGQKIGTKAEREARRLAGIAEAMRQREQQQRASGGVVAQMVVPPVAEANAGISGPSLHIPDGITQQERRRLQLKLKWGALQREIAERLEAQRQAEVAGAITRLREREAEAEAAKPVRKQQAEADGKLSKQAKGGLGARQAMSAAAVARRKREAESREYDSKGRRLVYCSAGE